MKKIFKDITTGDTIIVLLDYVAYFEEVTSIGNVHIYTNFDKYHFQNQTWFYKKYLEFRGGRYIIFPNIKNFLAYVITHKRRVYMCKLLTDSPRLFTCNFKCFLQFLTTNTLFLDNKINMDKDSQNAIKNFVNE